MQIVWAFYFIWRNINNYPKPSSICLQLTLVSYFEYNAFYKFWIVVYVSEWITLSVFSPRIGYWVNIPSVASLCRPLLHSQRWCACSTFLGSGLQRSFQDPCLHPTSAERDGDRGRTGPNSMMLEWASTDLKTVTSVSVWAASWGID